MSHKIVRNYYEFDNMKHVYLEDSFVLGCHERDKMLIFDVDFVLTKENSLYTNPKPDEVHCYKSGRLIFPNVRQAPWERRDFRPLPDASDSVDYGYIDLCGLTADGDYYLSGDWGGVTVRSDPPIIEYD